MKSLRNLEYKIGISRAELKQLASSAASYYHPFTTEKKSLPFPRRVKSSKPRKIDNPADQLKRTQRLINKYVLGAFPLPTYMFGGVSGKTVVDNVTCHLGAQVLVTIDVRSFFPSVTHHMVFSVWRDFLGFSPELSHLLTKLTTFGGHLPQGAPTSAMLANLVLHRHDVVLRDECRRLGITYTTWIDDLAFSGENTRTIIPVVIRELGKAGFKIARKKLVVAGPGSRKVINGILLNRVPSVLPEKIRQLRSGIHKLATREVPSHHLKRYVSSLAARIDYYHRINPERCARVATQFNDVISQMSLNRLVQKGLSFRASGSSVALKGLRSPRRD